jgi:hypothetical protein
VNLDALPEPPPLGPHTRAAMKRALRPELRERRGPGRLRVLAAGFAVAGLATTGAATYVAFREAPDQFVHCYSELSRDFSIGFPGVDVAFAAPDGERPDPVAQCAQVWRDGGLRQGESGPQVPDPGARLPVPELSACVLPDGSAAVFPGDAACARLGLPRYVPEVT